MLKNSKFSRGSTNFSTTENYVTVQIRNKDIKKKFSHHRDSVLNEIHATQSIINKSISKESPIKKSVFLTPKNSILQIAKSPKQSIYSELVKQKEFRLKQNRRKEEKFQSKHRMCEEIKNKLKQITNISYHFKEACGEKAKKLKTQACEVTFNYLLPNLDQNKTFFQMSNANQRKIPKNWTRKLRNGKSLVEKLKEKLSQKKLQNPLIEQYMKANRLRLSKQTKGSLAQAQNYTAFSNKYYLQDLYLRKEEERKSAPLTQRSSNNFYRLFCNVRGSNKQSVRQNIEIQAQQVRKLQQFVSGVQLSQFKQYDKLVHLNDFVKDKQNFEVLSQMYDYVKEKYAFKFKQMDLQSISQSNLLALVYYLENKSNMSQHQKKAWKSKMKFVE